MNLHFFSTDFRKILKNQISCNSVRWEPSCFMRSERRTDRQTERGTDLTKLTVVFRNFVNAPKNRKKCVMIDGKTIGQERNAKESEKKSDFSQFSNPKNCPIF